jgi:MFS family permease
MLFKNRLSGMFGFFIVWLGQIISVLASLMTQFALTIWVFEKTGSATNLGLVQAFFFIPFVFLSPIAGTLVDRYNRKLMMMASDLIAGLGTIAVLTLYATGKLEVWHLYITSLLNGVGNTFQWPAYSAAISMMISKEQYSRANGMMSLVEAGPGVIAPLLAGALLPWTGLTGILVVDVTTFLLAIGALTLVHIPQPPRTQEGLRGVGSFWKETLYGYRYIFERPGLLGIQIIMLLSNIFTQIPRALLAPMILLRTANNSVSFGVVQSAGALGGVAGAMLMSIWKGFKRRIDGVLLGCFVVTVFCITLGVGRTVPIWMASMLLMFFIFPVVNASNQAIWQAKVAPDVQGRVFGARRFIAQLSQPITPLLAGILADRVFEPAMHTSTGTSQVFEWLVGVGPGTGMSLLMVFSGICGLLVTLSGYFVPAVRNVEEALPDHDLLPKVETSTG